MAEAVFYPFFTILDLLRVLISVRFFLLQMRKSRSTNISQNGKQQELIGKFN